MNQHKKYIYLATLSYGNVFKTQIISWLNIYRQYGIEFDLFKIESLLNPKNKNNSIVKDNVLTRYVGQFDFILLIPKKLPFSSFLNSILLYRFLALRYGKKSEIVIQTRSAAYWKTLSYIRRFSRLRVSTFFDARAATGEELKYVHRKNLTTQIESKFNSLLQDEIEMVRLSDHVFCVSNNLKQYFMQKDPLIDKLKFTINPGKADPEFFYFDPELRNKIRKKLGIDNQRVIIYSGGLEMPWHLTDQIFLLFHSLRKLSSGNYRYILLTTESDFINNYKRRDYIDNPDTYIFSVDNNETAQYLNAADYGLILREDTVMNQVSAPTKFSEYMLCGLPVVISNGIGDFSGYISKNRYGIIFPPFFNDEDVVKLHQEIMEKEFNRELIASSGKRDFSKLSGIEKIVEVYNRF